MADELSFTNVIVFLELIVIFISTFVVIIVVHVLKLELSEVNRAASHVAEHFCTLVGDLFEDLDPHLLAEVDDEDDGRDEDCEENHPSHQVTLHQRLAFACLVV